MAGGIINTVGNPDTGGLVPSSSKISAPKDSSGKLGISVSNLAGSIGQSAVNLGGVATGLTKAVVSGVEGLPVIGPAVLKPVIGEAGKIVSGAAGSILPKKIDAKGIEEFANAPANLALEALTGPSQFVSEAVLRARIQNTIENKWDLVSLFFGNAPQSVVDQYRRGAEIQDIAESWVNKFGSGPESQGAFSTNGITNFLWTAITDPLNIIPIGKPFQLASRAATIAKMGGKSVLLAGRTAAEERLARLIAEGADNVLIDAEKAVIKSADDQIKFYEKWAAAGDVWKDTFGRIGDLKARFVAGPIAKNFTQAWTRVIATKGSDWALSRLSSVIGKSQVEKGLGDVLLTTANAAKAEMVQVATQSFRNRFDEAADNILKQIHELVSSGSTLDEALDSGWGAGRTIRQFLQESNVPEKEIKDLLNLFSDPQLPAYDIFRQREGTYDIVKRIGSSISNTAVAKDPDYLLRLGSVLGERNLSFATDAAVDVLTRDKSTIIRYAQSQDLGVPWLTRALIHGWDLAPEAAQKIANDAFSELGVGSRELLDVIDLARMKSFGKIIREAAAIKSLQPKSFAELPETIARRDALAKSFFPGIDPEQASGLASVLDHIARSRASLQGVTIEEWYNRNLFGIEGVSNFDDAVTITETLNRAVKVAKAQFENATPEEIIQIAERITPTKRMLDAAKESGVETLGKKSPVELVTFEGADKPFALPGGLAALDDPTKPFGLIDEVIIQSQPAARFMPGDIRVKIYKKIWASKGVDFNNPVEVANRVAFGMLSANTGLTPNAALYTFLRARNIDDLAQLAVKWGDDVRSGLSASEIGKKFKNEIEGVVEKKFPTEGPKGYRGIEIAEENIGRAIKVLVFASENPSWFTMRAGETPELLADRITLIGGAGVKVGTFAVEVMTPQLSRGAIDRQMSAEIFDWASKNGQLDQLVSDIFERSGQLADVKNYVKIMLSQTLPEKEPFTILGDEVVYGGRKTVNGVLEDVAGTSAPDIQATLVVKGWNRELPQTVVSAFDELPAYMRNKTPTANIYEGSVANVMNDWIEKIAKARSSEFPGLENLSGAQKQWFLWDLKRGNIEPHSWINKGVDVMEKPTAKQIGTAVDAITTAGGQRQGGFGGVNPEIISEFFQKNGEEILGSTSFRTDGKAMIQLFKGADLATGLHEIGHVARRHLTPEENSTVLEIYGVNDGVWTTIQEERFADDFTRYLYTGQSPVRDLEDIFYKMRDWLSKLWNGISGSPMKEQLDPKLKKVFDGLFIGNSENLAKPTADFYSRVTIISKRTMTQGIRKSFLNRVEYLLGRSDGGTAVKIDQALREVPRYVDEAGNLLDSGATFNPIRGTKRTIGDRGFSAAIDPSVAIKFTGDLRKQALNDPEFLKNEVAKFVRANEKALRQDGIYVGLYDSPSADSFFIDLSKVYKTADEAIAAATKLDEQSIFSFKGEGETLFLNTVEGRKAAEAAGKPVISSSDQIENLASREIRDVPDAEVLSELKRLTDDIRNNYDDPAAHFFNTPHSWEDIVKYVEEHPEVTARELNAIEMENLPEQFKAMIPGMDNAGYRFGVAPENGVIQRMAWASDRFGNRYITKQASPFVDLLDTAGISKVEELSQGKRLIPNSFDRIADKFRKYGPEVVKNNYIARFVSSITKKGISVKEAERIMSEVSNLAYRKETRIQGLWFERKEIESIFEKALGRKRFEAYIAENDPVQEIMTAAAGDMSIVGITSGFTGRAKAWRPVIGAVSDRLYPLFRFGKGNPIFARILEPIETKIMKYVDDIKNEYRREWLPENDSAILRKLTIDNRSVTMEIQDGLIYSKEASVNATLSAAEKAKGFVSNVNRLVRENASGIKKAVDDPWGYKQVSRDATAGQLAVREWLSAMTEYAPEYLPLMAKHYGVTDGNSLVRLLLEDFMVASNPAALEARIAGEASDVIGLYARTLRSAGLSPKQARELAAVAHGVWTDSMIRATRIADKMQYFSPMRSWFERSINHPFLGLYPYSYMTQKAIPAMLKIMFAPRVGGWVHPGMGYINYMRFREMVAANAESNDDFISEIVKSPEIGFALSIMVPALPDNMGFSAPGWLRRGILRPANAGQPVELSKVPEEIAKSVMAGTVAGQAASFGDAFASVNTPLSQQIQDARESWAEGLQRGFNK